MSKDDRSDHEERVDEALDGLVEMGLVEERLDGRFQLTEEGQKAADHLASLLPSALQ